MASDALARWRVANYTLIKETDAACWCAVPCAVLSAVCCLLAVGCWQCVCAVAGVCALARGVSPHSNLLKLCYIMTNSTKEADAACWCAVPCAVLSAVCCLLAVGCGLLAVCVCGGGRLCAGAWRVSSQQPFETLLCQTNSTKEADAACWCAVPCAVCRAVCCLLTVGC